jgi:hypothetical protein
MKKIRSSQYILQASKTVNGLVFLLFILKFPQILTLLYLKSLMTKYSFICLSSLTANTLVFPSDVICTRYGIHQLNQSRCNVSSYLTMNWQQTEDWTSNLSGLYSFILLWKPKFKSQSPNSLSWIRLFPVLFSASKQMSGEFRTLRLEPASCSSSIVLSHSFRKIPDIYWVS